MFFTADLLSRRDSGFGLLWLAATLGSKSAFKKLPKRSVMTADISQLCRLIATPTEPLALRLSSNLLVGAARVYRVKQEIFMSDVTTCFNALKRVEHELRSTISSEGQLQMAQPSVKSSTVTLRVDPKATFFMEFDDMVTNWDEYLNLGASSKNVEGDSNDDYHPTTTKARGRVTTSFTLHPNLGLLRSTACTLLENHDFLLANSFDASFGGSGARVLSSSETGHFGFDDTFDGLDIGEGVGDDLVRELGEGWGASPIKENAAKTPPQAQEQFCTNLPVGDLDDGMAGHDDGLVDVVNDQPDIYFSQDLHMQPVGSPLVGTTESIGFQVATCPSTSPPAERVTWPTNAKTTQPANSGSTSRKTKRARALLDPRTELTDEELKATRMYYLDKQNIIRCELEFRKLGKKQVDLIDALVWNAPGSVHAKELVDFWVSLFKAHVEARSGVEPEDGVPRPKRRKVSTLPPELQKEPTEDIFQQDVAPVKDGDTIDINDNADANWGDIDDYTSNTKNMRSSEEPGQPRRASHLPPAFRDDLGVEVISETFQSQRSALFPWDMAGSSSSLPTHGGRTQLLTGDRLSVEHANAKLRDSSTSRRGSSLPSHPGNLQAGLDSPVMVLPTMQSDDDFIFDVPGDHHIVESQQSETNRVALEKNSYNFLEYAKMQYKSLPSTQYLVFDSVVPKATSTARVAAAALYNCLVLATKDLLRVNQEEPYGRIVISIL